MRQYDLDKYMDDSGLVEAKLNEFLKVLRLLPK